MFQIALKMLPCYEYFSKYFFALIARMSSGIRLDNLSPNGDENEISPYMITTCSNIQMIRIKETITKDEMS